MDYILINKIIVAVIDVFGLWLGFWVLLTDRKNKANQFFFLITICIILWITFGYLGGIYFKDIESALISMRLNWAAICLLCIFAYFFSIYFTKVGKRYYVLEKAIIIVWLFFFFSTIFTDFIFKDIEFKEWGNEPIFGKGIVFFYLVVAANMILALYQLFRKYLTLEKSSKDKIRLFLLGLFVSAFFNFIFNIFFPVMRQSSKYYQLGDYSVIFIFIFTAYAILKRQLFGIKTVLTTFVISLISFLVVFNVFLIIRDPALRGLKIFILSFLVMFGYWLSRGVDKEVKRRQELEQINKGIKLYTEELLKERNLLRDDIRVKIEKLHQKVEELEEITGL